MKIRVPLGHLGMSAVISELQRRCVHDLVAASAAAVPNAVALVTDSEQLTYACLNARANQLAHFLRASGVGPEVLVGLCMRRTAALCIGILGILKAGGAYVPMDPGYPAERLSFMMQDSRAKILITDSKLAKTLSLSDTVVLKLDTDWAIIQKESEIDLDASASADNLAYVIYTSGSTGKPKGVMVTHAGLTNYLLWAAREYGLEASRSALVHSSVSFDLTITSLFTPLLLGGTVRLLADDAGIDRLLAAFRDDENYGLVKITPAHLEILKQELEPQEVAGKVGLFVIGGEALLAENLQFWRTASPSTRLINEYGPTETVVGCCAYEVAADDPVVGPVPIGSPIDNTYLYVLDDQFKILPVGVAGELYIGGTGVARGYLNRPMLTRERFLLDPFVQQSGGRMYRTGDLVRQRESGLLEYLGRLDDQIKLRGYRIEIGEIEAAIGNHPAVAQSAVAVQGTDQGSRLIGYAVLKKDHRVPEAQLRNFLRQSLPDYMIPAAIRFIPVLPLTANGKIDRQALLSIKSEQSNLPTTLRGDVEAKIFGMFEELLGTPEFTVEDNFFDLGGDSLMMMKLLVRIEKVFGQRLSVATVFKAPSISQLAHVLQNPQETFSGVISIQPKGSLPPFFCVGAGPLFRPLAFHLGETRPFLSLFLSHSEWVTDLAWPCTVEDIARYLIQKIVGYQREGPYYLGGWSASGVVAYEIAQQLAAMGHEVRLLVLFDSRCPTHPSRFADEGVLAPVFQKLRDLYREVTATDAVHVSSFIREKVENLRVRFRKMQIHTKRNLELGPDDITYLAVSNYRPRPYTGRVAFFAAASRPEGRTWHFSPGWSQLIDKFETHDVPGDHRSIFLEPHVASLATKLAAYFASVLAVLGDDLMIMVM